MSEKQIPKIIFDTDIGGDCDDAGALALLHRLCDKGEAELLAVTHCYSSPWYAGCIDSINRFYGREVPVGINYDQPRTDRGVYAGLLCDFCPNGYPASDFGTEKAAPDTLQLLRQTLTAQQDHSVTLVVVGALTSMQRLVTSGADGISPLTGRELIAQKIRRTVVMGGRFFESWPMTIYPDGNAAGTPVTWEWNIRDSGDAAAAACSQWPGELCFSSYEIGSYIQTLANFSSRAKKGDPVAAAYEAHSRGRGRCSWDLTAVLDAVRPGEYWHYHEFGKVSVDENRVTHWHPDENGKHTYLLPKADYREIRQIIDDLVDGK